VIKCATPKGPIGLGILGTIKFPSRDEMFFFVGNPPENIRGFDAFEMKMVAAIPETVRSDVKHFVSQKLTPEKLLDEVSSRYRGTIFASERKIETLSTTITDATTPEKIISQITAAIMRLAAKEIVPSVIKQKGRRRATTKSARARTTKVAPRRYALPRQFELMKTTLHI
jgi:hypothetical protein